MKKLLLVTSGIAALLCASCTSLNKTAITITEVRDAVMTELGVQYRLGLISPETDAKIARADAQYILAARTAAEALKAYKATGQGDTAAAILAVKIAVLDLINILAAYQNTSVHINNLQLATKL